MTARDLVKVRRKARQLAALAESTTFEGERQNARDAYFRLCDTHRLDPRTLESIDQQPTSEAASGFFQPPTYMEEFWAAQIDDPDIDFLTWFRKRYKEVLRTRAA